MNNDIFFRWCPECYMFVDRLVNFRYKIIKIVERIFRKMFRKELMAEWIILISVGTILIFMYSSNIQELIKDLLKWTFMVIGFKLAIDYGALPKLKEKMLK